MSGCGALATWKGVPASRRSLHVTDSESISDSVAVVNEMPGNQSDQAHHVAKFAEFASQEISKQRTWILSAARKNLIK